MDIANFWQLLDSARQTIQGSSSPREDFRIQLEEALLELEPDEVLSFAAHFREQFARTWHWDVLGAALIIYGIDCDELDIDGFRAWLVSQGAGFLDAALKDIDSLGDMNLVPENLYYYGLVNLAGEVYQQLTGEEYDYPLEDEVEPAGTEFIVKDLPVRFPKLCNDFAFYIDEDEPEAPSAAPESTDDDFDKLFEVP